MFYNIDIIWGFTSFCFVYYSDIFDIIIVFYFFIYRPQKKQEKETREMRSSIAVGDVIVTTGGIVGMVVKVREDMLLIETSGDRTKIQIQKWAVSSVLERVNEPEEPAKKK